MPQHPDADHSHLSVLNCSPISLVLRSLAGKFVLRIRHGEKFYPCGVQPPLSAPLRTALESFSQDGSSTRPPRPATALPFPAWPPHRGDVHTHARMHFPPRWWATLDDVGTPRGIKTPEKIHPQKVVRVTSSRRDVSRVLRCVMWLFRVVRGVVAGSRQVRAVRVPSGGHPRTAAGGQRAFVEWTWRLSDHP